MRLFTIGSNFYVGTKVPVVVRIERIWKKILATGFCLIFIPKGVGNTIKTDLGLSPFIAPTLCCINETESIKIQLSQDYKILELVFHPEFLNPFFDYKSLRLSPQAYIEGDPQEAAWLNAFSKRLTNYKGIINISSVISLRVENLLYQIDKELSDQERLVLALSYKIIITRAIIS